MPESKREIIANVPRLHQYMDRHRLAAVVVRSGQNFTYLSGLAYPGTLARHLDLPDSGSTGSKSTRRTQNRRTTA